MVWIKDVMQGLTCICIWKKGLRLAAVGKRHRVNVWEWVRFGGPTVTSWHFSHRSWRGWLSGRSLSAGGLWRSSAQPPAGSVCPGDRWKKKMAFRNKYVTMKTISKAFVPSWSDAKGHSGAFHIIRRKGTKLSQKITTLFFLCWLKRGNNWFHSWIYATSKRKKGIVWQFEK